MICINIPIANTLECSASYMCKLTFSKHIPLFKEISIQLSNDTATYNNCIYAVVCKEYLTTKKHSDVYIKTPVYRYTVLETQA